MIATAVRLFHFSDNAAIDRFVPRPTEPPKARPPGRAWLNEPLVWAIEERRMAMYLFPRDCPRILLWPLPGSTERDVREHFDDVPGADMVAVVEAHRLDELRATTLTRYEFPASGFMDLRDAGMWVSREAVTPIATTTVDDLEAALRAANVALRLVPSLLPYRDVWNTSLHASGIRLGNAKGWR